MRPALRWRLSNAAHRWRGTVDDFGVPHAHVWADTEDGVRLAGSVLGERPRDAAIVLVHGFMGFRSKPKVRVIAEHLAERHTVIAFDLRGHGHSGGHCTGGQQEIYDVRAAVEVARRRGHERVVLVGWSMGGIAVLRAAAEWGGVDGVVSISAPALLGASDTKAVRRATWLFMSPVGRAVAERVFGTRIRLQFEGAEAPAEIVHKIAPTPLLIVHGENDHFFAADEAQLLFERAASPKRLLLFPGFGHAEDGFTPAFAERLGAEIDEMLRKGEAYGRDDGAAASQAGTAEP